MLSAIDGDVAEIGPSFDNNYILSLYFIMFMLVGTYFFLNLFIGAICYHFDKSHKSEKCAMYSFMTEE